MNEKPRLKDSDEILSSLARSVTSSPVPEDAPPQGSPLRRRRSRPALPDDGDGPSLDFGKYELPSKKPSPARDDPPAGEPVPEWILSQMSADDEGPSLPSPGDGALPQKRGRGRPPGKKARQAAQTDPALGSGGQIQQEDQAPGPQTGGPSSDIGISEVNPAPPEASALQGDITAAEGRGVPEPDVQNTSTVKEYSFESFDKELPPSPSPSPSEDAELARKKDERRRRMLADKGERDMFMKELSQRFERRFAEKFEAPLEKLPGPPVNDPAPPPDFWSSREDMDAGAEPRKEEYPGGVILPEAEEFVGRFIYDTLEEEENRSREFKDTLAEKFMRERERYLKEIDATAADITARDANESGSAPEPEPPAPAKPQRRKLDFQIVPEMHLREGEAPPAPPVTYTRDARLRSHAEGEGAAEPVSVKEISPATPRFSPSKKTAEQLLLELAAQSKTSVSKLNTARPAAAAKAPASKDGAKPVKNIKKRTVTKRAVVFSAAAVMLMFSVVLWTFRDQIIPVSMRSPAVENSESMAQADGQSGSGTLTVYEDRRFSERGSYDDVLVKRPNVSLSNLSVKSLLVISDIETSGEISLRDVSVDGAIHVKSCAISSLNLTDVKAQRVVINNSSTQVTVRVSGNSDIGEIELKTPGIIEQGELSGDALGVRGIVTLPEAASGAINATLTGLRLPSLGTFGSSVLKFNDTYVTGMTSEGPVSVSGTGRITNLSIGSGNSGAAVSGVSARPLGLAASLRPLALTETVSEPLLVVISGVSVSNLVLRDQGDINISAPVDSMTLSDNMSVSGNGSIGSIAVNQKFGNPRLVIDISGPGVSTLTTEAETRLSVSGNGKVNNLICNASTYSFGNKVNNMVVNADNCIYENAPDRITRAAGIRPPESVAENPNLDYNAGGNTSAAPASDGNSGAASEAEAAVGTVCGHSRESGGFIYGDGSRSDPFVVSAPAQLAHISLHLNSFFIQEGDIDIADDPAFSSGFPVIAPDDTAFSGEYDGQGNVIKNLRIITDKRNVGLFGSNTGIIQNVHILSGEIASTLNQSAYVGAVTGFCYNDGQVLNCSNRARVTGKLAYVGGIVGYNYGGRIKDCYNAAKITAESDAGGIVGVSRQNSVVAGCYNAGVISAKSPVGGIVGSNDARIINCYYLEDTAENGVGSGDGAAAMRTAEELRSGNMVDELSAGNIDSLWRRGSEEAGYYNYPVLAKPPLRETV